MLIVISPAKTLDFESAAISKTFTQAKLLESSEELINLLTTKSPSDIEALMSISPKLSELNVERYHHWSRPFNPNNAKQAIYAFKGDVYNGLQIDSFNQQQLDYTQDHLRILSGLYGVLRPLDLIQAYRLEMGVKLENSKGKNLYEFWGSSITSNINQQIKALGTKMLLNLSSIEYFKAVNVSEIDAEIISPTFKDWKNGEYKLISFFAKKARGTMTAWVLKNKIESLDELIKFKLDGYTYSAQESSLANPVFLRRTD